MKLSKPLLKSIIITVMYTLGVLGSVFLDLPQYISALEASKELLEEVQKMKESKDELTERM